MTMSFVLIVSGGVSAFVLGLKKDREVTYNRQLDVNQTFEVFSTNTSVFETFRDELYRDHLSNLYLEVMYQEDKELKNKLSNYESLVDELYKNAQELDVLCKDIYFPDSVANNRCKNYKVIYEQVNNYFVSDIKLYNENIKKYNDYQDSNQSLLRLRSYDSSKDYLDYNHDNRMDGKEE